MKKRKAATYHEIAGLAGVSIGTVDRVMNNRGRVSPDTAKRVRKAVSELGYTKNIFASTLKRGKEYTFGIIMPKETYEASYWKLPAKGIRLAQKELERYPMDTAFYYYDLLDEASFLKQTRQALKDGMDGLVIVPSAVKHPEVIIPYLDDACPYTFLDSLIPGTSPLGYVGQNAFDSGYLAARLMSLLTGIHDADKHLKGESEGITNDPQKLFATWSTFTGSSNIQDRVQGFSAFFRERFSPGAFAGSSASSSAGSSSGDHTEQSSSPAAFGESPFSSIPATGNISEIRKLRRSETIGNIQLLHHTFNPAASTEELEAGASAFLAEHPDLSGIFVSNCYVFPFSRAVSAAESTVSAKSVSSASAEKKEKREGSLPIIGYDLIPENVEGLKDGTISFIINQRPFEQGYTSILSLFKNIVLQQPLREQIFMPIDIVTRENVDYYTQHVSPVQLTQENQR